MDSLRRLLAALATGVVALVLSSCATDSAETVGSRTGETEGPASLWTPVPMPMPLGLKPEMPSLPTAAIRFNTTEGTWMNVDVSPDGETIVFDLLGDLYLLPIEGGDAVSLTGGKAWDQAPRFSPDGTQVHFVSDREGHKNVWRLTFADHSLQQITWSETDILGGPNWSQAGSRLLVGVADRDGTSPEVILHAINPISGVMAPINRSRMSVIDEETSAPLRHRWNAHSGIESSDGKVFFSESQPAPDDFGSSMIGLFVFDRKSQRRATMTKLGASYHEHKPQLSHDGNLIVYFRQYSEHRTELRVLNRMTGHDDVLVRLTDVEYPGYLRRADSRPNYAFTPDDQSVIFWHAGKIQRVKLADRSIEIIPFRVAVEREVTTRVGPTVKRIDDVGEAATIRWPSLSTDGQTIVFSAFGYVWVLDMPTGDVRRLSSSLDFEYMPTISPDGQSVAYISFASFGDEYGCGRLMVADIDGRKHREILAESDVDYLTPQWSQDGSMIALIREVDRRRGVKSTFGWTYAARGAFHEVASATTFSDFAKLFIYSRQVKFDAAGDRLFFSYPRSRAETVLAAADLNGGAAKVLAIGTSEVGGIAPAPDLENLALTRRDGSVWVIPFNIGEETTTVSSLAPDARRVSRNGGYYVDWNNPEQLTFGLGKEFYRYRLNVNELQSFSVKARYPEPSATQPVAFTGARLITMSGDVGSGSVIESGTVVVAGARIVAIGPASAVDIPKKALVVDVTGKTIMPSLLDTHYHGMGDSSSSALMLPSPDIGDQTATMFGITSVWNPGGMVDDAVPAAADLQKAGRIVGPRLSHAAVGAVGHPYETLVGYPAAQAVVSQRRELGVDVLKEYNTPTRQQRQWLSAAAYESGLGIVSHLETFDGTMTRIVDGYTGGDHPSLPDAFYKDVHELLKQTGFIWTPNLVITRGITGTRNDIGRFYCDSVIEKQKQGNLDARLAGSVCGADNHLPTVTYDTHRVSRVAKSVALAASNGVAIGVSAHNKPGSELHREMWHLWKGGMPIEDVLQAAVNVNARKLGLQEEIGTLEPGKLADFLVFDKNPLENILYTLSLRYTVQGGVVYDSATSDRADMSEIALAQEEKVLH